MDYVQLKAGDIDRTLFEHFQRRQVVTKCRRRQEGEWVILDDPFVDDWTEADYTALIQHLRDVCRQNGVVIGAFAKRELKGFAAVKAAPLGKHKEYLDLPCIHVSEELRGQGIGRALFEQAKRWAKAHGAKKLYISAHSAVESQAFYRAMGCVEAKEYDPVHTRLEPCDCQLECEL